MREIHPDNIILNDRASEVVFETKEDEISTFCDGSKVEAEGFCGDGSPQF
jgi:hypothetical protein